MVDSQLKDDQQEILSSRRAQIVIHEFIEMIYLKHPYNKFFLDVYLASVNIIKSSLLLDSDFYRNSFI